MFDLICKRQKSSIPPLEVQAGPASQMSAVCVLSAFSCFLSLGRTKWTALFLFAAALIVFLPRLTFLRGSATSADSMKKKKEKHKSNWETTGPTGDLEMINPAVQPSA